MDTQHSEGVGQVHETHPEVIKEVLSGFQEHLDAFIAGSDFDDEERAFAIDYVDLVASMVNVKVWADTGGQIYAPVSLGDHLRLPEASEGSGEEGPTAEVAQRGKEKTARKHNRRRQKR